MTPPIDLSPVAKALASRLANSAAADDRYRSFAFHAGEGPPGSTGETVDERPAVTRRTTEAGLARDLVLRALGAAVDPVNDALLGVLGEGDAALADVASRLALPRMAVRERVNDLLALGLVAYSPDGDRAGLSVAGQGIAALVSGLVHDIAAEGEP